MPKGKLKGQWNLIANACSECNARKSNLEDDIAAITLMPDALGRFPHDDAVARAEAERRAAKSFSRRTRKTVLHSSETLDFHVTLGPSATAKFDFVSPPQFEIARGFELARMHLAAFFYMLCYDRQAKQGGWWPHGFHPFECYSWQDWGNSVLDGFTLAVQGWDCRLYVLTADAFFKAVIRRHPSAECWAWALEWNRSVRLVGFFGSREPAKTIVDSIPEHDMHTLQGDVTGGIRYRIETAIAPDRDTLFADPRPDARR